MPLGLSGESVSKLSSVWIKVAEGTSDYQNVTGANTQK